MHKNFNEGTSSKGGVGDVPKGVRPLPPKGQSGTQPTSTNNAMTAIKAICERTDPNEPDASVLRSAMNQIYATLTAS